MSQIEGIAAILPEEKLDLTSLSDIFGETSVQRVMKSTGIREIRIASPDKTASDYCVEAAEILIEKLGISRDEIDGLIFVSRSPDYIDPQTSFILQHRLKLSHKIVAMDLNSSCTGFADGMIHANALVESGVCHNVLLLAGDTLTRKVSPRDRSSRMVFGDAASATLVSKSDSEIKFSTYVDGARFDRILIPAGGARIPIKPGITDIPLEDDGGNFRSQEDHFMDGVALLDFVLDEVPPVIQDVVKKAGWKMEEVDLFALHQANRAFLKHLTRLMQIAPEKVPINLEKTGNTVSASIPLMLCDKFSGGGGNSELTRVVLCGFGSGLACAAVTTDLSHTKIFPTIETR